MEFPQDFLAQMDQWGAEEWGLVLVKGFRWVREKNNGRLPQPAYKEKVRTFNTPFVEGITVYQEPRQEPKVLLLKRDLDVAVYPGCWHFPGGNLLGRKTVFESLEGIAQESGIEPKLPARFIGAVSTPKTPPEIQILHLFMWLLHEKPANLTEKRNLFSMNDLPEPFTGYQRITYVPLIQDALAGKPPRFIEYLGE